MSSRNITFQPPVLSIVQAFFHDIHLKINNILRGTLHAPIQDYTRSSWIVAAVSDQILPTLKTSQVPNHSHFAHTNAGYDFLYL
jgi:hypothetical protein